MLLQGILTKTVRAMNAIPDSHSPPKNTAGAAHTRVAPPPPAVSCRFFAAFAAAFSLSNSATAVILSGARRGGHSRKIPRLLNPTTLLQGILTTPFGGVLPLVG